MSGVPEDVAGLLRRAGARIDPHEARGLLAHVMQRSPAWLFAHADAVPEAAQCAAFDALLARREAGEPVAYLTGRQGFWSLELAVTPATLIPRPETERLVELALERLPPDAPAAVADLGTGSGAIALAIARERPRATVLATDASAAALAVARGNARQLGIDNVDFIEGHWCQPLGDRLLDLIASNPPYIETGDAHLAQGDLRFEPPSALASGADGLEAIREIVTTAVAHLRPGAWLLLEHGWTQGPAVRTLLEAAGYLEVHTARDLEDRDRVSLGRRPAAPGPAIRG